MGHFISSRHAIRALALFALAVSLLSSGAFPSTPLRAAGSCSAPSQSLDNEEQAFVGQINAYRTQNGRGALKVSPTLSQAARWMAIDLSTKKYFAHNDSTGRSTQTRIADCGYGGPAGENLAAGSEWDTATEAMTAWKASPSHNENMLRKDYVAVGIARRYDPDSPYGWYWVADFGMTDDAGATLPPPPTPAPVPAVRLEAGANLISWGGSDAPPAQAFAPVAPTLTAVYSWDPGAATWNVFGPTLPAYVNTLRAVHRGDAYWVIAREQVQLPLN